MSESPRSVEGPLAGLSVLDVSPQLPGPFCTQMLADLGAEVTRVEPPAGDLSRQSPARMFEVMNRNKRSLALDLHDAEHRAALYALVPNCDIVVEGYRPGVAERLGVDYTTLAALNDQLIYCSISGYGQEGPDRLRPGHELTYLAGVGALDYSGHWSSPPHRSGVPFADALASTYAAVAILAALQRRVRDGVGARLDLAISDVLLAVTGIRAGPGFDIAGADRRHLHPTNELFEASDGRVIAIAAIEDHFWEGLRDVIARRDDRILDHRHHDAPSRHANGDALTALLREVIAAEPSETWVDELSAVDVPVAVVLTAPEAFAAAVARGRPVAVDDGGRHVVRFPVLQDGVAMAVPSRPAPELGSHTLEVLRAAGVQGISTENEKGRR